jgi:transposase
MKQQTKSSNITVGLDLGDRRHRFCALDERGEVVEQDSICNDRDSLRKLAGRYHGALGVMEAGAHSPWISRFLEALGWRVVVSNPRKVRAIYQHERKSDQRDALMLARIGRMVSKNTADVTTVAGWLAGSDVDTALRTIDELEKEAERIKKALSAAKKALAQCLLD